MCLSLEVKRPEDVLGRGEHAGFQWRVIHNRMGVRCGYVRVPQGHPWHGRDYSDIDMDVEVHGGLTFSEADEPCDKGGADNAHWFGFDCGHTGDAPDPELPCAFSRSPMMDLLDLFDLGGDSSGEPHIWTQEEVEAECRSLCEQARKAKGGEHAT